MSLHSVSLAPITAYITTHLTAGWRALRGQPASFPEAPRSEDIWPTPPVSLQAMTHPGPFTGYVEDVDPLTEAEVYALFGRLNDAVAVLAAALEEGRISDEQVASFWIEREVEQGIAAR